MALSVIQSGTNLQLVSDAGIISPTLTLPTGITLRSDIPPRFVVFGRYVILVNTPSQPLIIDSTGTVRLLCPKAPRLAPILSAVAGGTLTGSYGNARYTFVTLDPAGNLISESDFSPASNTVTLATQFLQAANLDISPDQISGRRIYRPTNLGAVLFQWVDLDGNILTSIQDDLSDAGLSLVAAPLLGTPPDLTMIAEFRNRLFGVDRIDIDDLRYTEVGLMYAWTQDNVFPIPSVGSDSVGVRALLPRREYLGIGRQNQLLALTGTDDTDFSIVKLSQNLGVSSQESVAVYRDVAYFLWEDGVYQWSDAGIECVSDGKALVGTGSVQYHGSVRSWFATDNYFNRSMFQYAFGQVDPVRFKYRLYLFVAGSTTDITWVEYDLIDKTWWGPHLTSAFSPTSVFTLLDGNLVPRPTVGATDSNLYREQDTRTDGPASAIIMDVQTKRYGMDEPDLDKYYGELSVVGKAQTSGTMNIHLEVGELNASVVTDPIWDMTQSRQRLQRVGTGKHVEFEFTNDEVGQDVQLYGIEVAPVSILGRR
jgi:hypothetical protein